MSSKTIFITGGSGYVGKAIITQAIAKGYTITALSRNPASDGKLRSLGATPIRGDLTTCSVITEASSKADVLIQLADALASDYNMSQEQRKFINNGAIDAMAEGIKGTGKPLILTGGTLLAMPREDGGSTDEESPGWPADSLIGQMNTESRNLAWKAHGIRTCMIRLAPYVYGHAGSGVAHFMKAFAAQCSGFYLGDGEMSTTTVHVDDAAQLYMLAIEKAKAGEKYNAAFEVVTQKQIAEAIGRALGVEIRSMSMEEAEKSMGHFMARFLSFKNRASGKKAREELGWVPKAEMGVLEEIAKGSYAELAKTLKAAGE